MAFVVIVLVDVDVFDGHGGRCEGRRSEWWVGDLGEDGGPEHADTISRVEALKACNVISAIKHFSAKNVVA